MSEHPNRNQGTGSMGQPEPEDPSSRTYRRRALMLGTAAAGAGAAVSFVARPEVAAAESPDGAGKVVLGKANTATTTTSISMSVDDNAGVAGFDTSSGGGYGVAGVSTSGYGIHGVSTDGVGAYGETQADGQGGVEGIDVSSGGGYGVSGSSTKGKGVYGESTDSDGLHGQTSGAGACGVYGYDGSTGGGYGVNGQSENGYGVYGTSAKGGSSGVYGHATAEYAYGVYGEVNAEGGIGVLGSTGGVNGNGVSGEANSENGTGVWGTATGVNGTGVIGVSNSGGNVGVFAGSTNGIALYADGTSEFIGAMSKPGGSFKIDHPGDPEGKYLFHSFVESPDMMNVYNGTVTLDSAGRTTVELPEWFEALNRDYRYQLTALLGAAPELHVSALVADGKFSIAGGKAGQQVSWMVTGIRQDAWANANRIPVEVDKKAEDQGRYLHPEVFGGEPITTLAKARDRVRRHQSNSPDTSTSEVKH